VAWDNAGHFETWTNTLPVTMSLWVPNACMGRLGTFGNS